MEKEIIREILSSVMIRFCFPGVNEWNEYGKDDRTIQLHKHPAREMLFVLKGENDFAVNDHVFHLSPGVVVLIDSWSLHSFGYRECDHDLLHMWFFFEGQRIRTRFCRVWMGGKYLFHDVFNFPNYAYPLFNARWNALKKRNSAAAEESEINYLTSPFRCLLEEYLLPKETDEQDSEQFNLVSSIKIHIESQNGRSCSLMNLEKIFGYSRFHIAHKFRELTGLTIGEYINEVRRNFTENALQNGMKQKEIADELGFSTPASYWKWYHKKHR